LIGKWVFLRDFDRKMVVFDKKMCDLIRKCAIWDDFIRKCAISGDFYKKTRCVNIKCIFCGNFFNKNEMVGLLKVAFPSKKKSIIP
jgi:hypothetical protein